MPKHASAAIRRTWMVLAVLLLLPVAATAGDIVHEFRFDRDELKISNLVGRVEVVAADDDAFHVTVTVRGADAAGDLLQFRVGDDEREFAVVFPLEEHDRYVYPELDPGRRTVITVDDDGDHGGSWLKQVFAGWSGKRVTIEGRGRGKEVWADLVVAVPRGGELDLVHRVGRVDAVGVVADLRLDTSAGPITARDITGDLVADTGSGDVSARGVQGDVSIDTGSGDVELVRGEGREIKIDTGSGSVVIDGVTCRRLHVDTGSGGVEARGVDCDGAVIDTGSGAVLLGLDRLGGGRFVVDTGSGDITLVLPEGASARVTAETGSGTIRCRLDGAEIEHEERDELRLVVGAGEASVSLDAGSGSIEIKGI